MLAIQPSSSRGLLLPPLALNPPLQNMPLEQAIHCVEGSFHGRLHFLRYIIPFLTQIFDSTTQLHLFRGMYNAERCRPYLRKKTVSREKIELLQTSVKALVKSPILLFSATF